ncbi:hypothetical protein PoB_004810300 [Plakobranchus ocellatus]|uniref:Uncharacterized protein n=1 Tax=Plakobranchus ocellatus TaxID=259542 RepID=A0AAV4BRY3_9GAST|nr:hypothetical protein PoB_004810300 [Plakobranchus ocellatus]
MLRSNVSVEDEVQNSTEVKVGCRRCRRGRSEWERVRNVVKKEGWRKRKKGVGGGGRGGEITYWCYIKLSLDPRAKLSKENLSPLSRVNLRHLFPFASRQTHHSPSSSSAARLDSRRGMMGTSASRRDAY